MISILPIVAYSIFVWCGIVLSLLRSRRRLATFGVLLGYGLMGRLIGIAIVAWLFPSHQDKAAGLPIYFSGLLGVIAMWRHAPRTRDDEPGTID
jgi:hypothetical protein